MFFALIFVCTRISQIVTLTPIVGMLAWFVSIFNTNNVLTPDPVLVLFIVSVLALAWAAFTLFSYHRSSHNALFVAFVDVCFVGALITGVYYLRAIANAECQDPAYGRAWTDYIAGVYVPGYSWAVTKPCAMLKASWAFAIMNCIFFAVTSFAAWSHGDSVVVYKERVVRTSHSHSNSGYHSGRHSHRHRSHSGGSRHSHHSQRRVYV